MAEDKYFVPVRAADIVVGQPLQFAIFDADHVLLLNRGVVVTSEHQLEVLLEKGLYREQMRPQRTPSRAVTLEEEEGGEITGGGDRPREEVRDGDAPKLAPGDVLQMQPLQEGQTERWTVRVIGLLKGKSLLVTAPVVDGKLIFIKDGQTFLVRAFSGLNVCAFKARVLKSQLQPYPYLHLSWPDSVQAMRIRKAMRAPVNIIVAVLDTEDGRQSGSGKIVDISVGGAKLLAPTRLGYKDDKIWLSFKVTLGDMEEYVKTPAIIRTIGEETDEQGRTMKAYGMQFGELNQSQRLIIMNVVYHHVLKEPV
ncbi:MAG: flagellar brake protein [Pseudomonadota bacterium]